MSLCMQIRWFRNGDIRNTTDNVSYIAWFAIFRDTSSIYSI